MKAKMSFDVSKVVFVATFCIYLVVVVWLFVQWREDNLTRAMAGMGSGDTGAGSALGWVLLWGLICGPVGKVVGNLRGHGYEGAAAGLLLGPLGWLGILCMEDLRPHCPDCRGVVPEGARKCLHCGSWIESQPARNVPGVLVKCPACGEVNVIKEVSEETQVECAACRRVFGGAAAMVE